MPITLAQYFRILSDIDAYLASGGQLLKLPLLDPANMSEFEFRALVNTVSAQQLERLGRFCLASGALVGDCITESQAQELWRATAVTA